MVDDDRFCRFYFAKRRRFETYLGRGPVCVYQPGFVYANETNDRRVDDDQQARHHGLLTAYGAEHFDFVEANRLLLIFWYVSCVFDNQQ
ncbi:hypothetical protein AB0758_00025 [Tolypothrix bouteillei VB521301_2]|uniref:hypothetical protein n=1 Tax=Tolypothrix bouteillei TaxID=1246981 RepID=UPI0038B68D4C